MSVQDVIRAWKDADYRERLSDAQRALLPAHPAGLIELSDVDLGNVAGGITLGTACTDAANCTDCFQCPTNRTIVCTICCP